MATPEKQSVPQQPWNPANQPPAQQPLGTYAPQPGMIAVPVGGAFPTATFCPATGGAHEPEEHMGLIGIIIGIVFCPCGIIACCLDKKITCRQCKYVIKESWGGA